MWPLKIGHFPLEKNDLLFEQTLIPVLQIAMNSCLASLKMISITRFFGGFLAMSTHSVLI